jgi:phosphohistidine phosphatase
MPTLVLVRHAKAEAQRLDDHSRVLAARGRADASDVRAWFVERGIVPELAIVSTAARTRETWALADPGTPEIRFDDRVYEATTRDLREVIGEATGDSLVVVGHNPSIEQLSHQLDPTEETNRGMRTSGVAVFEVDSWDLAVARLTAFR